MKTESPRSLIQRKQDTLKKLETDQDVWVATADSHGRAHLIPLSLAWDGSCVIVATETASRTVRNVAESGQARLALGPTRDVVVIDATVRVVPSAEAEPALAILFAQRNGWDPLEESGSWAYLILKPKRIQAWRNIPELSEKTLMKDSIWLV